MIGERNVSDPDSFLDPSLRKVGLLGPPSVGGLGEYLLRGAGANVNLCCEKT
jgi:hypothetical protein